MSITRKQAQDLGAELNAAIDEVLARHGLKRTKSSGSYGDEFTHKITASALTADGLNEADVLAWKRHAALLGLPVEGVGLRFTNAGRTFTVTGLNPKATKRPIIARCEDDGKTYVFEDTDGLKAKLHAAAAAA